MNEDFSDFELSLLREMDEETRQNLGYEEELGPFCNEDCRKKCDGHSLLDLKRATIEEIIEELSTNNPEALLYIKRMGSKELLQNLRNDVQFAYGTLLSAIDRLNEK